MAKSLLLTTAAGDPAIWLVCLLGVAIVFAGLVCLIGLVYLMGFIVGLLPNGEKAKKTEETASASVASTAVQDAPIENRSEIVAAVCAAIAEANGTDISAIRVISFKKV